MRQSPVIDGRGNHVSVHLALHYRFFWADDGLTDVAFLCDERGRVYGVEVLASNGEVSRPFQLARVAVQIIGRWAIDRNRGQIDASVLQDVQELIDQADVKRLLEWLLRIEQSVR